MLKPVWHLSHKRSQAFHALGCRNVQLSFEYYTQHVLEPRKQGLGVSTNNFLRIKPVKVKAPGAVVVCNVAFYHALALAFVQARDGVHDLGCV